MNHAKEDVLPAAEGLWVEILTALTSVNPEIFDSRKEHPCPLCGGKTRFRLRKKSGVKLDKPFYCNHCGSRSGIEMLMELTGLSFFDAINDVGNHLNMIPTERREVLKREYQHSITAPKWYNYDPEIYDSIKKAATVDLSAWQRVNGLNMLDILKHGENALVPLLNKNNEPFDFAMIDVDGNWQTTGGNKTLPSGVYSVFGSEVGKRSYVAVSPLVAAHAAVFTGKMVHCCYELANLWDVAKNIGVDSQEWQPPVVICANLDDVQEADSIKLEQLMFNPKNRTVNRRLWKPFEYMDARKENGKTESN